MILNAQRIPLNADVDDTKPTYFYLNVDGLEKADAIKRAFWFKTVFRQEGNRQPVTEDRTARVRFAAERQYPKDSPAKLLVKFAVDNPPPNAKLAFQLYRDKAGHGIPVPSVAWKHTATDKRLGFDVKGGDRHVIVRGVRERLTRDSRSPGFMECAGSKRIWSTRPARTSPNRTGSRWSWTTGLLRPWGSTHRPRSIEGPPKSSSWPTSRLLPR